MTRPTVNPRGEEKLYFEALQSGKLTYGYCTNCDKPHFYIRTICPHCHSTEIQIREGSGKGKIHSFTTQYRAGHPALKDDVPYTLVLVDLIEGYRMLADLIGAQPAEVSIGRRVQAEIDQSGEQPVLHFRLEAQRVS